jgi:hypothetical protein
MKSKKVFYPLFRRHSGLSGIVFFQTLFLTTIPDVLHSRQAQPAFALCTHKRWPQARNRWVQASGNDGED